MTIEIQITDMHPLLHMQQTGSLQVTVLRYESHATAVTTMGQKTRIYLIGFSLHHICLVVLLLDSALLRNISFKPQTRMPYLGLHIYSLSP